MKLADYFYVGVGNHLALRKARRSTARTESGAVDARATRAPVTRSTKRPTKVKRKPLTEEEIDRARGYVSKLGGQAK
jgi:hypothetical protein